MIVDLYELSTVCSFPQLVPYVRKSSINKTPSYCGAADKSVSDYNVF